MLLGWVGVGWEGDMTSWETQQYLMEEVNPGSNVLVLNFYRIRPYCLHELVYYFPFLVTLSGIMFMHFPNFAGKVQFSKPKQMGAECTVSHWKASFCSCHLFLVYSALL